MVDACFGPRGVGGVEEGGAGDERPFLLCEVALFLRALALGVGAAEEAGGGEGGGVDWVVASGGGEAVGDGWVAVAAG